MASLGLISLYSSFILMLSSILYSVLYLRKKNEKFLSNSKKLLLYASKIILISGLFLIISILNNDYTIKYIASYSDSNMPLLYKLASFWGGQEGSLLLWLIILNIYKIILLKSFPKKEKRLLSYIIIFLALSSVFFIITILLNSNPFDTFASKEEIPFDGIGLNPQLQTISMLLHPPFLYLGFVGFNIVISFTLASLLASRNDNIWIILSKKWILSSWIFLFIGNILGSFWAYIELGWGGFWAWDAVENSSFIPWLTASALIHSVNLELKKNIFKKWNIFLSFITFFFTILGTFITRSGFIESVHSFARSKIGWYFLSYLIIFTLFFVILFLIKKKNLNTDFKINDIFSKEAIFLYINILFLSSSLIILFGTLLPSISSYFGNKISIGENFFNKIFSPIAVLILILFTVHLFKNLKRKIKIIAILFDSILVVILFLFIKDFLIGYYKIYSFIIISFCIININFLMINFFKLLKKNKKLNKKNIINLIHLGVMFIIFGISGSSFKIEKTSLLKLNDSLKIKKYTLVFKKLYTSSDNISKDSLIVDIDIYKNNKKITKLSPHKNYYNNLMQGTSSEVAIYSNPIEDLYLSVEGFDFEKNIIFIRAYINPLMFWLWLGSFLSIFFSIFIIVNKNYS